MADLELGKLVWKITGDDSGIKKTLKATDAKVKKTGGVFSAVGKKIFVALAAAGVARFGKHLIDVASDAEETANKFGVVFSSVSEQANAAAASLATSYGFSRTASKDLLSATGDLLNGFQFTQDAALATSVRLNSLAADLVSFKNVEGGVARVSDALNKAILGERESLAASAGIKILDKDLKDFAESQGKNIDLMSRQDKATLTLDLITKLASNSIGDFERSMNSFANQSRIAEANVANLEESLGKNLLPVATVGLKMFNSFAETLDQSAQSLNQYVTSAEGATAISSTLGNIVGFLSGVFEVLKEIFDAFGDAIGEVFDTISELTDEIGGTSGAMVVFAGVGRIVAMVLRAIGSIIALNIKAIFNLGKAFFNVGKSFKAFSDLIVGEATFEQFQKTLSNTGAAFKKFGVDIVDGYDFVFTNLAADIQNFEKDTDDLAKKATGKFVSVSESVQSATFGALTATQTQMVQTETAAKQAVASAKKLKNEWDKLTNVEKFQKLNDQVSQLGQGIIGIFTSLDALSSAQFDAQIAQIDARMQAELNAAGVREETQIEQAQRELDAAMQTGDALEIEEKRRALTRAEIEEKYQKEKRKLEYESALAAWDFKLAAAIANVPLAISNAVASGFQAPFFMLPWFPIAMGATAGINAGLQIASVAASKPEAPRFEHGGIVPGNTFSGDRVPILANSGEGVFTREQMQNLAPVEREAFRIVADRETLWREIFEASENGDLLIAKRATV